MFWIAHLEGGPQRVNHAAVAVGSSIYSFGGYTSNDVHEIARGIDVYVLNTDTLRWKPVEYTAEKEKAIPYQRYGHTVVVYDDKIYLFGGRNDIRASDSVYCFCTKNHRWSRPVVGGNAPMARDGHSACVIGEYMYIFGGYEEEMERFSNEVHRLNLTTLVWEEVETEGIPPEKTDFHTASAIGDIMYVFGGRGIVDEEIMPQIETYCPHITYLDTKRMKWVRPHVSGKRPVGRRSHSAVVYENKLYIMFGYNSVRERHYKDIHCFDPETNSWSEVICQGEIPCARRRQCCCVVGDKMFMFGGTSPIDDDDDHSYAMSDFDPDIETGLKDLSDLHVLDFFPTLKTLCLMKVISQRLDYPWLPALIKKEISCMTVDNWISKGTGSSTLHLNYFPTYA